MNALNPMSRQMLESLAAMSFGDVLAALGKAFPDGLPAAPTIDADPSDLPDAPDAGEPAALASNVVVFPPPVIALPPPVTADSPLASLPESPPAMQDDQPEAALAEAPAAILADVPPPLAESPEPEPVEAEPVTTVATLAMSCDAADLAAACKSVQRVIPRRNTIPILDCLLIRATGDGTATVEGTDLDAVIRVTIPAEADAGFAVAVNAWQIADLAKKASGRVALAYDRTTVTKGDDIVSCRDGDQLRITFGATRTRLQTRPVDDYPRADAGPLRATFTIPAPDLVAALKRIEFAISTEESRYYLNGVYLHARRDVRRGGPVSLRVVATDGHRLAMTDLPDEIDGAAWGAGIGSRGIIVPRSMVSLTVKLLPAKPPKARRGEPTPPVPLVTVEANAARIRMTCGSTVIVSKLVDGTFPEYRRVIPDGNDRVLRIDSTALAAAVDRVSTVSSERGKAVKLRLSPGADLELSTSNPDSGSIAESVGADYQSDGLEIGFNAGYLLDILSRIDGTAELRLCDPGSPALIRAEGDRRTLFVLMPMRV